MVSVPPAKCSYSIVPNPKSSCPDLSSIIAPVQQVFKLRVTTQFWVTRHLQNRVVMGRTKTY